MPDEHHHRLPAADQRARQEAEEARQDLESARQEAEAIRREIESARQAASQDLERAQQQAETARRDAERFQQETRKAQDQAKSAAQRSTLERQIAAVEDARRYAAALAAATTSAFSASRGPASASLPSIPATKNSRFTRSRQLEAQEAALKGKITNVEQAAKILACTKPPVHVSAKSSTCATFESTRFFYPVSKDKLPRRILLVSSRDSGQSRSMRVTLLESLIYALRYICACENLFFEKIVIWHVADHSSQLSLPATAQGNVAAKWKPFMDAIDGIPAGSHVHWVVRGWDGVTTQQIGLRDFIQQRCAGYANQQQLTIDWIHIQARSATTALIQNAFGDPHANGPQPPSTLWWPLPTQDPSRPEHPARRLERIMRARPHPPFSHHDYMRTMSKLAQAGNQASRNADPCLCILWVWAEIDRGKASGINGLFNNGRSTFV